MSAGLRRYLYWTAGTTGAAIMIVEILGAKMLAPYVGTSHFVWTAQIAVTLVGLTAGYYAGGWLVNRAPQLGRLYWAILGAAIYLAFAALVVEPVAYWCLDFKLAFGSLLAVAAGYFFAWGRKRSSQVTVAGGMALGLLLGGIGVTNDRLIVARGWREIYRANSNFGLLQVISGQNDTRRYCLNDFLLQNT